MHEIALPQTLLAVVKPDLAVGIPAAVPFGFQPWAMADIVLACFVEEEGIFLPLLCRCVVVANSLRPGGM